MYQKLSIKKTPNKQLRTITTKTIVILRFWVSYPIDIRSMKTYVALPSANESRSNSEQ